MMGIDTHQETDVGRVKVVRILQDGSNAEKILLISFFLLSLRVFSQEFSLIDNLKIGMTMDEVINAEGYGRNDIQIMELETISCMYRSVGNIQNGDDFFLILSKEYFFYNHKLTGVVFFIYDDFPIYYGIEERMSYRTNMFLYEAIKKFTDEKHGKGNELREVGISDSRVASISKFIIFELDEGEFEAKTITVSKWDVGENVLSLNLILYKNGNSRKIILFGSPFFNNGYLEVFNREINMKNK
jgi:hypothetical protein